MARGCARAMPRQDPRLFAGLGRRCPWRGQRAMSMAWTARRARPRSRWVTGGPSLARSSVMLGPGLLLLALGLLGGFDVFYFHRSARITERPQARREAWLHIARGVIYT